jgi:L,D-transpeptidase catalytic domain
MALVAPTKTPHEFGFGKSDRHLIVNDETETIKAFDYQGDQLWERPCLARGQKGECEWRSNSSDTPPGLYKLGEVFADYEQDPSDRYSPDRMSYGWYTFDMIDLEGNEDNSGRSGICMHGGGSGNGWPGAWSPKQFLLPTLGCVRLYNQDLRDLVLPLYKQGTVFVSVYQEA